MLGDEEPASLTVVCVLSTRDRFGGGDISSVYGVSRVRAWLQVRTREWVFCRRISHDDVADSIVSAEDVSGVDGSRG